MAETVAIKKEISAVKPYESRFISVKDSKMAYWEAGEGDPILFLHGNPTSKYLWRNIMPYLESQGRVIAPDLIGMGESEKPDLSYRYSDHYAYLEAFIEVMGLDNITLVIHDWGSGLGFNFAYKNQDKVKAIAFMEAITRPMTWDSMPAEFSTGFKLMRTPGIGWLMVNVANIFIKQMLPQSIVRELSAVEQAEYASPYPTITSRKPLRVWPAEVPINGSPADVNQIVSDYSDWLQKTDIPKLFFYASPGAIISEEGVEWIKTNFSNLTSYDMGAGIHFVQEDNPHFIGEKLAEWHTQISETAI